MENDDHQDTDSKNTEHWLNSFEQQCLENWSDESKTDDTMHERERVAQKMWLGFQNTATTITQLYKDRYQGLSLWIPFQNAASSVTAMYKDSLDTVKICSDASYHHGRLTRNRDIISWATKKCRHIRRDELIAFLCGKTPPPIRNRLQSSRQAIRQPIDRHSPRLTVSDNNQCEEPDLQPFRDALILQGLNGAMSNVSVGYIPHNTSPSAGSRGGGGTDDGLNRFILDQLSRQCEARKRSASSDVIHDSPSRKRSRLL